MVRGGALSSERIRAIEGTADQPKRRVKQAAALTGDAGLKTEGVVDETEGKMEVAAGGPNHKSDTVLADARKALKS